jgi:hypothetical protein
VQHAVCEILRDVVVRSTSPAAIAIYINWSSGSIAAGITSCLISAHKISPVDTKSKKHTLRSFHQELKSDCFTAESNSYKNEVR